MKPMLTTLPLQKSFEDVHPYVLNRNDRARAVTRKVHDAGEHVLLSMLPIDTYIMANSHAKGDHKLQLLL